MASFPWSFHWFRLSLTVRPEWDFCKVDSSVVWYWWRPCLPTSMASFALWWYQLSGKWKEKCLENLLKSSSQFLLENCILPMGVTSDISDVWRHFTTTLAPLYCWKINQNVPFEFCLQCWMRHFLWFSHTMYSLFMDHGYQCHYCHDAIEKYWVQTLVSSHEAKQKYQIPNLLSSHHRNQILGTKYFQT